VIMGRVLWRYFETNHNALCALGAACRDVSPLTPFERIDEVRPGDLICYSFKTSQADRVGEEVRILRDRFGGSIKLIAGGPHPSGDPRGTLDMGFDAVFVGPCEEEFKRFLRGELEGEIIRGRSVVISRYPISSDELPMPKGIEISRGCPHGCKFCQVSYIFGRRPHHRPPEMVAEFIRRRGMRVVRFVSPNSLAYMAEREGEPNLEAIEKLLKGAREAGAQQLFFGTFPSEVRPDWVTEEAMRLIKRWCDNKGVVIGAQSGSDRMLRLMGRGHTVEDVERAVEITLRVGLQPRIDLIFWAPGETEEDREETFKLVERMGRMNVISYGHIFMPLPGTPWADVEVEPIGEREVKMLERLVGKGYLKGNWRNHLRIRNALISKAASS